MPNFFTLYLTMRDVMPSSRAAALMFPSVRSNASTIKSRSSNRTCALSEPGGLSSAKVGVWSVGGRVVPWIAPSVLNRTACSMQFSSSVRAAVCHSVSMPTLQMITVCDATSDSRAMRLASNDI